MVYYGLSEPQTELQVANSSSTRRSQISSRRRLTFLISRLDSLPSPSLETASNPCIDAQAHLAKGFPESQAEGMADGADLVGNLQYLCGHSLRFYSFLWPFANNARHRKWLPLWRRHARLDRGWGPMVSASTCCAALANTTPQQSLLDIYT
ncbi:hypothetical protein BD310DRAFT_633928 [Dichomitus squalens]|uniref:Uncharacterized protein n=1 Tax=Dichomitus squalens TaxID=114155 RepID=A0A4Q9PQ33_9APHY|nr:hypothetical protein BD310DRAFT_633928 [Dichomitus squalens]